MDGLMCAAMQPQAPEICTTGRSQAPSEFCTGVTQGLKSQARDSSLGIPHLRALRGLFVALHALGAAGFCPEAVCGTCFLCCFPRAVCKKFGLHVSRLMLAFLVLSTGMFCASAGEWAWHCH